MRVSTGEEVPPPGSTYPWSSAAEGWKVHTAPPCCVHHHHLWAELKTERGWNTKRHKELEWGEKDTVFLKERKIRSWFDLQSICLWCWCCSSSRSRHRHYQQTEGSPVLSTALVSSASTSFTPERTAQADPLFWKHLWSNDKTDMKQKWVCHLWFSVISEHLGRNAASLFKADKPIV